MVQTYGLDNFVEVDWHNSGQFVNPDAQQRGSYYGVGGVPDVYFDGYDHEVGGGTNMLPYYTPHYLAHSAEMSKVIMEADVTFDEGLQQGTVNVTATIAPGESITNSGDVYIGAAIYIRNWNRFGTIWHDLAIRRPLFQTTTIANAGETDTKSITFSLDPATINNIYVSIPWDWCELRAVGFIQRLGNKHIINSDHAIETFHASLANIDAPVQTSTGAPVEVAAMVTCDGALADDVTLTLDKSSLPAGWDAEIEWNSATYPTSLTIPAMAPGQTENVIVRTIPSSDGGGSVSMSVAADSYSLCSTPAVYSTFVNTPAVLFVDDDNGEGLESYYIDAIVNSGHFYVAHEFDTQSYPTADYLAGFDAVVWGTGSLQNKTIGANARAELETYLAAGGTMFLTSHGILNQYGVAPALISTYMNVASFTQDTQAPNASGVASDPIGDGIAYANVPPFVDLSDEITPGAGAAAWLNSAGSGNPIGIRYDSGTYRTVFMSSPWEGVPAATADVLMGRILDWLVPSGGGVGVDPGLASAPVSLSLSQNSPNPFRGSTLVRFAVPQSGPVDVSVFDVTGRLVANLVNGSLAAGPHSVSWDGSDSQGNRVASGIYLYRIQAGGESLTKDMVHLR